MAESYQLKGISFPFHIGVRGGVSTSVANYNTPQKIVESYQQILGTNQYERSMEYEVFSQIDALIFESADETLMKVLEYMVKDALNSLEKRAKVNDVVVGVVENYVVAVLNFTVINTGKTYNTVLDLRKGG